MIIPYLIAIRLSMDGLVHLGEFLRPGHRAGRVFPTQPGFF